METQFPNIESSRSPEKCSFIIPNMIATIGHLKWG